MAMATGLDRLERFFTKRKASTASSTPSSEPSTPTTPTDMQFPSPPFIRPKASRMAARDEFRKQESGKSPSTPGTQSPQRKTSSDTDDDDFGVSSPRTPPPLVRTSGESLITALHDLDFPSPPSKSGSVRFLTPQFTQFNAKALVDAFEQRLMRPSSPLKLDIPTERLDKLLGSDQEDELSPTTIKPRKFPDFFRISQESLPTPELSPELGPVFDPQLQESKSVNIIDKTLCRDIKRQLEEASDDRPISHLSLLSVSSEGSSSTYEEPCLEDFFTLEDDEIAESYFDHPISEAQMESSTSTLPLCEPPFLTLAPPPPSPQATVAALEAARIAGRYNFDMLYIANLWSEREAPSTETITPRGHMADMRGAILAAYGLQQAPSPFQISAQVHVKILGASSWLEYRDQQAQADEFGSAYACAFHNNQQDASRSISQHSNNGIVFAAYRKLRADGNLEYSTKADLALLRRDVEALVEILIDMDATRRERDPSFKSQHLEENDSLQSVHSIAQD